MYDVIDRPVDQLAAAERATLMAIRRWVHAFSTVGAAADTADDPFAAAMAMLDQGSSDDLAIGRPCQPIVGESEAVLLGLWRLVRTGNVPAAGRLAAMIVDAPRAAPLVAAIGASLAA